LFLENGDFLQKFGMFIDADGLFEYSNFCAKKRYNLPCNENLDTVKHLITNELQAKFPITKRRQGEAVLIALQYELDAPVQFSFPFKTKISPTEFMLMVVRECIGDEEIIVRPHPKHLDSFEENKAKYLRYFKPNWKLQIGSNTYSFLQANCKGMVTIHSTLAIEGAAMGIDVAVLGKRTYTGAGVVHDLYENGLDSIKKLGTFQVAPNLVNYLCALLNHTLSYPITKQKILDNEQFQIWIERCKNGSVFNHNG
jgi:capsule polysaccharide modification protein KpsS